LAIPTRIATPESIRMRFSRGPAELNRPMWSIAATVGCLMAVGCASPTGPGWANFKSDKAVDIVASDDSFPAASEVGLAMTERPADKNR
jgi:hypothetical protein